MYKFCSTCIWQGKKQLTCWLPILISFKVVPLWLYTLHPAVLPLLETFLEVLFWYVYKLCCRILHYALLALKSRTFRQHFQLGEQGEITSSHVWRVRSLENLYKFHAFPISLVNYNSAIQPVIPFFNLCNPKASLRKACWILWIVLLWVSPRLWQNLIQ